MSALKFCLAGLAKGWFYFGRSKARQPKQRLKWQPNSTISALFVTKTDYSDSAGWALSLNPPASIEVRVIAYINLMNTISSTMPSNRTSDDIDFVQPTQYNVQPNWIAKSHLANINGFIFLIRTILVALILLVGSYRYRMGELRRVTNRLQRLRLEQLPSIPIHSSITSRLAWRPVFFTQILNSKICQAVGEIGHAPRRSSAVMKWSKLLKILRLLFDIFAVLQQLEDYGVI